MNVYNHVSYVIKGVVLDCGGRECVGSSIPTFRILINDTKFMQHKHTI